MEDLTKTPCENPEINPEQVSQNEEVSNIIATENAVNEEVTPIETIDEPNLELENAEEQNENPEKEETPIVENIVSAPREEEQVSEKEEEFQQKADEIKEDLEKGATSFSETPSKMSDSELKALESLDTDKDENESVEEEITENYLTHTREQLLATLEELINNQVEEVRNKIALIKVAFYSKTNDLKKAAEEKFLAEGGIKEDFQHVADSIEEQFKKVLNIYREKRQKYLENIERAKQENLEKKMVILEELKTLINSEEMLKKTYDEFKNIQDRWREIGAVPRTEVNNLWRNYHFLIEKFFDKVKINRELKMLDLKKNLEQKIELCEKAEELLLETSIAEATKKLQSYREKWREIGPVPSEKNEEIWERFSTAGEQIDLRKKEYYENMREEYEHNLLAKKSLCEKAEELLTKEQNSIKDWNDTTVEFDELLKLWKTIGNAPKNVNNEIWARFKSNLDIFFGNKKEYFDGLKEEQSHNYNLKLDICKQAEEIAKDRTDWKRATGELLQLQKQWKEIGNVSRKLSDKLWLRFRAACDEFFKQKEAFFADAKSSENENLAKKEDILKRLKEYPFTENSNENLQIIKGFQREWMDVGYVPITDKDRLQNEFRTVLNQLFEKLKISVQESQKQNYKTRLENLSGKASGFISREKSDLQDKIQKLKSNLNLWENNLGFLSQSKQADLLKQEFERKMQSARNEIALFEMKLKMLLDAKNAKPEDNKAPKEADKKETKTEEKPVEKQEPTFAEPVEQAVAVEEEPVMESSNETAATEEPAENSTDTE